MWISVLAGLVFTFSRDCDAVVLDNLPNTATVGEGTAVDAIIFNVVTTSGVGDLTYSTESHAAPFSIDANGVIKLTSALDYDAGPRQYIVTVSVTDDATTDTGNLTVDVTDVDEAPNFANLPQTVNVREDATRPDTVLVVAATDPEGQSVSYSCSANPDDGAFDLTCTGGAVKLAAGGDFSAPHYVITVTATAGPYVTDTLTVDVINVVNDIPVLSPSSGSASCGEDTVAHTSVFHIDATDADGDALTYTVSDTAMFSVDSAGNIFLEGALDYEATHTVIVTFKACDSVVCSADGTLTINVQDANDPPVVTYSVANVLIEENTTVPYRVPGQVDVSDPDGSNVFTYALVESPQNAYFSIQSNTGVITLVTQLDYDDDVVFPDGMVLLSVSVTDDGNKIGYGIVNISIGDVNEFAPVFEQTTFKGTVMENAQIGSNVIIVNATDGDKGPVYGHVNYLISPPWDEYFTITTLPDGIAGQVKSIKSFDRETYPSGTISAVDGDGKQSVNSATVVLDIGNENDMLPVFTQTEYEFVVRADADIGDAAGNVVAIDGDAEPDLVTYKMVTNDTEVASLFFINYLDGQVTVNGKLTGGKTYEMYAEATEDNTTRKAEIDALVRVKTFDQVAALVDWELDTGGRYMGSSAIAEFENKLAATCTPCKPKVVETIEKDNGNWIFRVYILTSSENATSQTFMTKEDILNKYTTDGRKTPTAAARALAPSGGVVVAINESYEDDTTNWWLDDIVGNIVLAVLSIAAFGLVSTAVAVFVDFVWFSRRPT
ncbi:Cadherin EGF LAG seven-pass G-type receptor 2 [Lamellibrachia satsuma]|nr:Cadherin EGF LAG seven-pass G-type receptor 2 [Lamellibrachia satsuma]